MVKVVLHSQQPVHRHQTTTGKPLKAFDRLPCIGKVQAQTQTLNPLRTSATVPKRCASRSDRWSTNLSRFT